MRCVESFKHKPPSSLVIRREILREFEASQKEEEIFNDFDAKKRTARQINDLKKLSSKRWTDLSASDFFLLSESFYDLNNFGKFYYFPKFMFLSIDVGSRFFHAELTPYGSISDRLRFERDGRKLLLGIFQYFDTGKFQSFRDWCFWRSSFRLETHLKEYVTSGTMERDARGTQVGL
jgi:hypothetical protein